MCKVFGVHLIPEISRVIVLTGPDTHVMIKMSSPQEIINRSIERNYKRPLKNSYMIFMIDCSEAFKNIKKRKKKISEYYYLIWKNASEEVKDEYSKIFENYKRLRPNVVAFRHTNEGQDNLSNQPEDLSDNTSDPEEDYKRLFDEFINIPSPNSKRL